MNSTACGHRHLKLNSKLFDSFFVSVICDWMFDVAWPGLLYSSFNSEIMHNRNIVFAFRFKSSEDKALYKIN